MIVRSAEVRWFFRQTVPAEAVSWFRSSPCCSEAEDREDQYLRLDDCSTVGIKIRSNASSDPEAFEVKALCALPRPVAIGARVTGLMEGWIKWSVDDPAVAGFVDFVRVSSSIITVAKRRWLRKISFEGGVPTEVPCDQHPERGCNAELTTIEACATRWWTIGLEAFGPTEGLERAVLISAAQLFGNSPPIRGLVLETSKSYPAWLAAGLAA
jgi:hypothetical protein